MKYFTFFLLTAIIFPVASFAYQEDRCITEKLTLLGESRGPSTCSIIQDLTLQEGLFEYPYIDVGLIKVRYWEARLLKKVVVTKSVRHEYFNNCTGTLTYSRDETFNANEETFMAISKPNLDVSIKESFKLAPITSAEAISAWKNLRNECDKIE